MSDSRRQRIRAEIRRQTRAPIEPASRPTHYLYSAVTSAPQIHELVTAFDATPPFRAAELDAASKLEIWATTIYFEGPDHHILKLFTPAGIREARVEGY